MKRKANVKKRGRPVKKPVTEPVETSETSQELEVGTVGWLIEQLKKHDPHAIVMSSNMHEFHFDVRDVVVRRVDLETGVEVIPQLVDVEPGEDLPGLDVVCLLPC